MMHREGAEGNREGEGGASQNPQLGNRIESIVNDLLSSFMDIFSGSEFVRMRSQYSNFNQNDFMNNFN